MSKFNLGQFVQCIYQDTPDGRWIHDRWSYFKVTEMKEVNNIIYYCGRMYFDSHIPSEFEEPEENVFATYEEAETEQSKRNKAVKI